MRRIEYLQYQYYDAEAKWWTAGTEELTFIRDPMLRPSKLAEGRLGEHGLPLRDEMWTLAHGIEERLFERSL